MRKRDPIPAAYWWQSVGDAYEKIVRELLGRAQKAERVETGHECGHRFEITVRSAMHSGIAGEGPESHSDADWWGDNQPVTVRAHNLRDALLIAASLPLTEWFPEDPHDHRDDATAIGDSTGWGGPVGGAS